MIKNKNKYKKNDIILNILVGLSIVGIIYFIIISVFSYLSGPVNKERPKEIEFESYKLGVNYSLKQLSQDLEDNNIIKDKNIFFIKSYLIGEYYNYNEGVFLFNQGMTTDEVIYTLLQEPEIFLNN